MLCVLMINWNLIIIIIIIIIKYREKGIMPVSPAHYNKQLH